MRVEEEAREKWERSAAGWLAHIERGDVNRTELLDAVLIDEVERLSPKTVADIGCGEGRFCRMLKDRSFQTVGVEMTALLAASAKQRDGTGWYIRASAETLPLRTGLFDLALSYLVLIDVPDFRSAISEMVRIVRPAGHLLVANLNPFITTHFGWYRDAEGRKLHYPLDDYYTERPQPCAWGDIDIFNWHRPMEAYMRAFLAEGLILRKFLEPRPSDEAVERYPRMSDEQRVPLFHVMVWEKP